MMSDDLSIGFEVRNVRAALQSFRAITAAANEAADAQQKLTQSGGGTALAPRGGSRGNPATRYTQGPFQRRETLLRQRSLAELEGNVNAQRDVNIALMRNARQMRSLQPKSFAQRLESVIRTSRFGGGERGGIQPLIGRSLDLLGGGRGLGALGAGAEGGELAGVLGGEAAGGPVGLALAAVTLIGAAALKGAEALEKLAAQAAESSQVFQGLKYGTGGTTGETARLQTLGGALGLNPSQTAGLAQSLQENISGGGFGQAAGLRAGIYNLPQPFGNTDTAGQLIKALTFLRNETGPQQIRDARALGLQDALPGVANLSNRQFGMVGGDAALSAQIFNPRFAQQSADFEASLGRVSDSVQRLIASLAPAVIQDFTSFFNGLADAINSVAGFISRNQASLQTLSDLFAALGDSAIGNYAGAMRHIENITSGKDELTRALDANTQATAQNTAGTGQPGVYGNISRDVGLPTYGYGAAIRMNSDAQAYRLGIYA